MLLPTYAAVKLGVGFSKFAAIVIVRPDGSREPHHRLRRAVAPIPSGLRRLRLLATTILLRISGTGH